MSTKRSARAMPVETILTRNRSRTQQFVQQSRKKNITKPISPKSKPTMKPMQHNPRRTKAIKSKDVQNSSVKPNDVNSREFYPDRPKRNVEYEKVVLKPKHCMKMIGGTKSSNKRKLHMPRKEMKRMRHNSNSSTPSDNESQSPKTKVQDTELTIKDMVLLIEEEGGLNDEDLLEILTCPSPVWWEDPPDGYIEEPIFARPKPAERKSIKNQLLEEQNKEAERRKLRDEESTLKTKNTEILDVSNLGISVENRSINFMNKRGKLESLLGSIRNKVKGDNRVLKEEEDKNITVDLNANNDEKNDRNVNHDSNKNRSTESKQETIKEIVTEELGVKTIEKCDKTVNRNRNKNQELDLKPKVIEKYHKNGTNNKVRASFKRKGTKKVKNETKRQIRVKVLKEVVNIVENLDNSANKNQNVESRQESEKNCDNSNINHEDVTKDKRENRNSELLEGKLKEVINIDENLDNSANKNQNVEFTSRNDKNCDKGNINHEDETKTNREKRNSKSLEEKLKEGINIDENLDNTPNENQNVESTSKSDKNCDKININYVDVTKDNREKRSSESLEEKLKEINIDKNLDNSANKNEACATENVKNCNKININYEDINKDNREKRSSELLKEKLKEVINIDENLDDSANNNQNVESLPETDKNCDKSYINYENVTKEYIEKRISQLLKINLKKAINIDVNLDNNANQNHNVKSTPDSDINCDKSNINHEDVKKGNRENRSSESLEEDLLYLENDEILSLENMDIPIAPNNSTKVRNSICEDILNESNIEIPIASNNATNSGKVSKSICVDKLNKTNMVIPIASNNTTNPGKANKSICLDKLNITKVEIPIASNNATNPGKVNKSICLDKLNKTNVENPIAFNNAKLNKTNVENPIAFNNATKPGKVSKSICVDKLNKINLDIPFASNNATNPGKVSKSICQDKPNETIGHKANRTNKLSAKISDAITDNRLGSKLNSFNTDTGEKYTKKKFKLKSEKLNKHTDIDAMNRKIVQINTSKRAKVIKNNLYIRVKKIETSLNVNCTSQVISSIILPNNDIDIKKSTGIEKGRLNDTTLNKIVGKSNLTSNNVLFRNRESLTKSNKSNLVSDSGNVDACIMSTTVTNDCLKEFESLKNMNRLSEINTPVLQQDAYIEIQDDDDNDDLNNHTKTNDIAVQIKNVGENDTSIQVKTTENHAQDKNVRRFSIDSATSDKNMSVEYLDMSLLDEDERKIELESRNSEFIYESDVHQSQPGIQSSNKRNHINFKSDLDLTDSNMYDQINESCNNDITKYITDNKKDVGTIQDITDNEKFNEDFMINNTFRSSSPIQDNTISNKLTQDKVDLDGDKETEYVTVYKVLNGDSENECNSNKIKEVKSGALPENNEVINITKFNKIKEIAANEEHFVKNNEVGDSESITYEEEYLTEFDEEEIVGNENVGNLIQIDEVNEAILNVNNEVGIKNVHNQENSIKTKVGNFAKNNINKEELTEIIEVPDTVEDAFINQNNLSNIDPSKVSDKSNKLINDYYKHRKERKMDKIDENISNNNPKKDNHEKFDKVDCKSSNFKNKSILISENENIKYCLLCSSIYDTDNCKYCIKKLKKECASKNVDFEYVCDKCHMKMHDKEAIIDHLKHNCN